MTASERRVLPALEARLRDDGWQTSLFTPLYLDGRLMAEPDLLAFRGEELLVVEHKYRYSSRCKSRAVQQLKRDYTLLNGTGKTIHLYFAYEKKKKKGYGLEEIAF